MEQGMLFDFPKFKITKKIRLIELFGGIGSQAMALRDIGADFEHYKLIEFDKYAVQAYNAVHDTQHTTHDIRQTHAKDLEIKDKDKYCYLMTYSFPCTDLSVAGRMKGMSKEDWKNGNSTRSGLLWEVERILKECTELPDVLLMENVPQVHAEQNKADFDNWCNFLRSKGYINHWQDLNAKDYGIPQNRDRCFMVSILSDNFIDFSFPKPVRLEKVMRDFLEESVDEKYYINTEKAKKLIDDLTSRGELKDFKSDKLCASQSKSIDGKFVSYDELTLKNIGKTIANGITARIYKGFGGDNDNAIIEKQKEVKIIGQMDNTIDHTFESANRVYDKEGLCPTIPTCAGGNIQPKIIQDPICVGGLSEIKWGSQYHQQDRVYSSDGLAMCHPANIPEGSYKYLVAMRGRNPERPTDRAPGLPTEQRLELNHNGTVNTLTTVQKDNLVLEKKIQKVGQISNEGSQCGTVVSEEGLMPTISAGCHGYANAHICINQATKEGSIKCKVGGCFDSSYPESKTRRGRVQNDGDVTPTITAEGSENINYIETEYRIRKLTPKECWCLMGYTDEDFEKAHNAGVSNSQLYKQAGNAIVKQVLMAIFSQML